MEATYRRITLEELARLHNEPEYADHFFGFDFDEEDEEGIDAYFAALEVSGRYLDIGKIWHGLHFLLTEDDSFEANGPYPLCNVVMGGSLTEWEASCGTQRLLMPDEVRDVAEALQETTSEDLRAQYDPEAFNRAEIYPDRASWDKSDLPALLDAFEKVKRLFLEAAYQADAMLLATM